MNISELFKKVHEFPKRTFAILEDDQKITYGDIINTANKISHLFVSFGLQQGEKVLLSSTDKLAIAEVTLAAYRFGLTVILLDFNSKKGRVKGIIEACKPSLFIVDPNLLQEWNLETDKTLLVKRSKVAKSVVFKKLFNKAATNEAVEDSLKSFPACLKNFEGLQPVFPKEVSESAIAYIMYTSGSTSEPKGVMITHANLFSHLETLKNVYKMDAASKILNVLNPFHADGINQGPLLSFYCGSTWLSPFGLDTTQLEKFYFSIYKYEITHAFVVPTLLAFFEKLHLGFEDSFKTSDFKFLISVAAQLDARLWQSVMDIFKVKIINVYGLTETVNGSIYCGPEDSNFKVGTIGKPVDCEVKIVDENGNECLSNEKGELLLKGTHIMLGYYNNAEENKQIIKDGWLHTGDIALKDEDGFYSIVGRKKSMINAGGFRIQPEEIEEVILTMEGVDACKVIGVPDPILIEKIIAFLKVDRIIVKDEVVCYKFLRALLEPEKVPSQIIFVDDFQRGISGKIMIEPLKNLALQTKTLTETSIGSNLEILFQIAANVFKVKPEEVSATSSSINLAGWDSMNNFIYITTIEERFKVQFSTSEIMSMKNIQDIDRIITMKLKNV